MSPSVSDVSLFDPDAKDKLECKAGDEVATKEAAPEERKGGHGQGDSKNRVAGKRSYEEICKSYESMFAFDWELKDINNLRHPPGKFILSSADLVVRLQIGK